MGLNVTSQVSAHRDILLRSVLRDWLKRAQIGVEISLANSRRIRLLRPFGPDALPTTNVFKTDSTSSLVNTILSKCELSLSISGISYFAVLYK